MSQSITEENYLKAIYRLSGKEHQMVSTNQLAESMGTTAASTTDMMRRLGEKGLSIYEKYKGVRLTESGNQIATQLLRRHRLWEVFLMEKLQFNWDEVHEIAEELEHIQSETLVERLDKFLGSPKVDPHGDPIPDSEGNMPFRSQQCLAELNIGESAVVVGVRDSSTAFLQYLNSLRISLGSELKVVDKQIYDQSVLVQLETKENCNLSQQVARNLFVQPA